MIKTVIIIVAAIGITAPAFAKSNRQKDQTAKAKCLKEDPSLKGKELKRCIKKKR